MFAMNINDWQVLAANPLGQLLENTNQAFWVCSPDLSKIIYLSPTYEKIFGRQISNFDEGIKSFIEPICTEDKERVNSALKSLRQGAQFNEEYRIVCPDSQRWIHDRAFASLDASGNIQYIIGIAEDITDKKTTELGLKQSEQRFQEFANNVDIVFWLCEPDASKFYYINPGYEKIWGKSCEDIYQNPRSFLESVHPDDLERIIAAATGLNACNMDEQYRIIRPDGAVRWVRDKTYPVYDKQGNLFRMVGIAFDITEYKQAETMLVQSAEQYRQLAENIDYVSWLVTPDASQILYISPNYEQVWGKSCASLYENSLSFIESILPEDKPRVFAAVEEDYTRMNLEYRIVRPNGTVCWIHARNYPIKDSSGNTFRVVGIAEDITLRKLAEEETLRTLQRARELSDAKSNFIANISHEIRTPLATIQSSIDMLQHYKDQLTENKKQGHFQKIETAIQRITQIVQDILLLSEAEANALQFQPCSTDISKLCSDAIAMVVSFTGTKRNVELSKSENIVNQAPVIDPKLVTYIITNLLDNALKYSNQDTKVRFCLDCTLTQVTFSVIDEGIGISNEDLPHIFDSFYRAKNIGNISGTGLGLAIVKQCVDLHKGEITVNSVVGNGTSFTVILPLNN